MLSPIKVKAQQKILKQSILIELCVAITNTWPTKFQRQNQCKAACSIEKEETAL